MRISPPNIVEKGKYAGYASICSMQDFDIQYITLHICGPKSSVITLKFACEMNCIHIFLVN